MFLLRPHRRSLGRVSEMDEEIVFVTCEECGEEQAYMGRNVACEQCGARMPEPQAQEEEQGDE